VISSSLTHWTARH